LAIGTLAILVIGGYYTVAIGSFLWRSIGAGCPRFARGQAMDQALGYHGLLTLLTLITIIVFIHRRILRRRAPAGACLAIAGIFTAISGGVLFALMLPREGDEGISSTFSSSPSWRG